MDAVVKTTTSHTASINRALRPVAATSAPSSASPFAPQHQTPQLQLSSRFFSTASENNSEHDDNSKKKNENGNVNNNDNDANKKIKNAVKKKVSSLNKGPASNNKKKQTLPTLPVKGTRDFFPPDMRQRDYLFSKFHKASASFGFEQYDAPVVESEELYTRKAGEEVAEQLYSFVDKNERRLSLRPEMTPSLARMVMSKGRGLQMPIKWYSLPQCWRYERMTRGRRREHYQWNMDIWGVDGLEAEVELLAAMITLFKSLGLTANDVGIKINSRTIIADMLQSLGVVDGDDQFASVCVIIDKLDKVEASVIQNELVALGVESDAAEKLIMTLKDESSSKSSNSDDNNAIDRMNVAGGLLQDSSGLADIKKLFILAKEYDLQDWLIFDPSVVRGLSYYTGVVFEAFDRKGELRAIAGGGRYDKLLESFGGKAVSAVGFGFGDAVIIELLKERGLLPDFEKSTTIDFVIHALDSDDDNCRRRVMSIATTLRSEGKRNVDVVLEGDKRMKGVLKHGNRIGAKFVIIVGSDEEEVEVKNMFDGEQSRCKVSDLLDL
jgi:histidyl-tRNA synthetase